MGRGNLATKPRNTRRPWRRMSLLAAVLLVVSACGSVSITTPTDRLAELASSDATTARLPVIVMAEPFFSGDFEPFEVYEKTYDVVEGLSRRGLSVVGPSEYATHNPRVPLIQGSDLVLVMRAEGVKIDDALELSIRFVSLGASRRVSVQGGEEVLHGANHVQPAEIRVTLTSLWSREVVMEMVAEYSEDPMSENRTDYERLPGLSEALDATLTEVGDRLIEAFGARVPEASTAVFVFNPKPMFDFTHGEDPPLATRFVDKDAMEQIVGKLRYYQYFDPEISVDEVVDFEALPAGLRVVNPGEFATQGLEAGDFIAKVGPTPALGAHVLMRQAREDTGKPLELSLVRGGAPQVLVIPAVSHRP